MPTLEEAANTFAKDMVSQNFPGLMMVFTPEGMMKAMAMQGQIQQRAMEAMAAGRTPPSLTGFTLDLRGADADDQAVQIVLQSSEGTAEVMTRWREIDGIWKVNDVLLVGMFNADGTPVTQASG